MYHFAHVVYVSHSVLLGLLANVEHFVTSVEFLTWTSRLSLSWHLCLISHFNRVMHRRIFPLPLCQSASHFAVVANKSQCCYTIADMAVKSVHHLPFLRGIHWALLLGLRESDLLTSHTKHLLLCLPHTLDYNSLGELSHMFALSYAAFDTTAAYNACALRL